VPALDRLEQFLANLPAGFAYGTAERIHVRRLLLALFAEGQLPEQLGELKTLLAPIVCTNRDQQDSFYRSFDEEFLRSQDSRVGQDDPERKRSEHKKKIFRMRAAMAVVLVLVAIGAIYHFRPRPQPKKAEAPVVTPPPPTDIAPEKKKPEKVTSVTGRVLTSKGVPVQGADVWIPGKHTSTGPDGTFSLAYAPTGKNVSVLVADPRYRSKIALSTFQQAPNIRLDELAEKSLPAVGTITAAGEAQRLWSHGDGLAAFSETTDTVVIGGRRREVELFSGSRRSWINLSTPPMQLAFDPELNLLAVVEPDRGVELLRLSEPNLPTIRWSPGISMALLSRSSGSILAAGTSDGGLVISGRPIFGPSSKVTLNDGIQALAFRPDGSDLVVAGQNWFWNIPLKGLVARKPTAIHPVEGGAQIAEMQFDPSGRYILLRNRSGAVDVWDSYGQRVRTPADWPTTTIGAGFSNGTLRIASATRWNETLRLLPWIIGLVTIAGYAGWLFWLRRKRARLNRISLPREMSTYSLHAPNVDPPFRSPAVKKLGQEMRRRKPGLTLQLSLEASIQASARSAGFFVPVYRERTQQREFLILIEKIGRSDQQERFYQQLAEALAAYTFVELYTFQSSPANVRDHIAGGWIDLQELAARYPEHDVWIVADPADFIDPVTQLIPEWMRGMLRWRDCALLSPNQVNDTLRALLAREGIALGSASIGGMTELLTASDLSVSTGVQDSPVYPRMLRRQPLQWIENLSPGAEALQDVMGVAEDFLGPDGMLVLRACAIYPETFWKLTLWLAHNLLPASGGHSRRDGVLMRLTSLPWFRYGQIPDWMRARLVNGLGVDEEGVRGLVEEFLTGVKQGDPELVIARRERGKASKVQDYVMFSFLLGRKVDEKLAMKPPSLWMRLFFHGGRMVFGPRLWVHAIAGILVAAGMWFGTRAGIAYAPARIAITAWKLPDPSQPPAARQFPSTPMRRAMVEVADSLVGEVLADWVSAVASQASLFVTGSNALQNPVSSATAAPGLLYKDGVIESITGNQAVVLQAQNGLVRRFSTALPTAPFLDYSGCVAGQQWVQIPIGATNAIVAIAGTANGDHLVAVGKGDQIFTSTDQGRHWIRQISELGGDLYGVFVTSDGRRAWAAGDKGIIYSTDGGANWVQADVPSWPVLKGVYGTPDGRRLWAVGFYPSPLISTDFGQQWSRPANLTFGIPNTITGTPDGKVLWAVEDNGRVLISRNFGQSWTSQNPGTTENLDGVFASADARQVFVSDEKGAIYGSSDSGAHWVRRRAPSGTAIVSIQGTPDGAWLWAFGERGTILESNDVGVTWKQVSSGTKATLWRGFVTEGAQTIWVGGDGGTLLKSDASQGCSQGAGQKSTFTPAKPPANPGYSWCVTDQICLDLRPSANPSVAGNIVTFTATGAPQSASGTVQFLDGKTVLGTAMLSGGTAMWSSASLAVGTHFITAVYSGDTNYAGSTSATVPQIIAKEGKGDVVLASSANPSTLGASVTFTATVTPASATGVVGFREGSTVLGGVKLDGGSAKLTLSNLAVGMHVITAVYYGDKNNAASFSPDVIQIVNKLSSNVDLMSSQDPSTAGTSVTFTANVSPASATGSVQFLDASKVLGTVTLADGVAKLMVSNLDVGAHPITAVYSGDRNYIGVRVGVMHVVNKPAENPPSPK
jgi:photosystem II stability/assembly factor-like uncharacterized protein